MCVRNAKPDKKVKTTQRRRVIRKHEVDPHTLLDLLPRRRYRPASCYHFGLVIHQLRANRNLGQLLGGSTRTSTGILRVPILQVQQHIPCESAPTGHLGQGARLAFPATSPSRAVGVPSTFPHLSHTVTRFSLPGTPIPSESASTHT